MTLVTAGITPWANGQIHNLPRLGTHRKPLVAEETGNGWGHYICYFSAAVIKDDNQKKLWDESVYFGLSFLRGKSFSWTADVAAGAGSWEAVAQRHTQGAERTNRKWGCAYQLSKPIPSDILPAVRLDILKVSYSLHHQTGTKYPNPWASGGRFSFKPSRYVFEGYMGKIKVPKERDLNQRDRVSHHESSWSHSYWETEQEEILQERGDFLEKRTGDWGNQQC